MVFDIDSDIQQTGFNLLAPFSPNGGSFEHVILYKYARYLHETNTMIFTNWLVIPPTSIGTKARSLA